MQLVVQRAKKKLTKISKEWIREGYGARPSGLSELIYITNPLEESRTKRALMVLESEDQESIQARVQGNDFKFKIPKSKTVPALRTNTGIRTIDIAQNHDYIIKDKFDGFDLLINFSKYVDKKSFDWQKIESDIRGKENFWLCRNDLGQIR